MLEEETALVRKQSDAIVLDYAKLSQLILKELNTNTTEMTVLKKYKKEDLLRFLEDPARFQKELRNISIALYHQSTQYRRLIHYFADMLTLDYIVVPNNGATKAKKESLLKSYENTVGMIENMNIKHEYSKMLVTALREDVFYGYQHETPDSYFIQELPADYCMISSTEDGVYNFSFDFAYFDGKNKSKLLMYPPEFKSHYNAYSKDKKLRWQELDSRFTVCIKVNEEFTYPVPPFVGVFLDIFDLRDYKALRKTRERIGNYMLLVQEIPIRKDGETNNDYLITLDHVKAFHNSVAEATPPEIGVVTSPLPIKEIRFDKDAGVSDKVSEAQSNIWDSAGVSQLIFNSDKSGAIGLSMSVKSDEASMFRTLRQLERFTNRKIKNYDSKNRFSVVMPDLTVYNRDDKFEQYLKSAQFGFPTKMLVCATLGLSPSAVSNMLNLENDLLGLPDSLIPVMSSHTATGEEDNGRPKKKEGKLTDSGTRTRDKETDKRKA